MARGREGSARWVWRQRMGRQRRSGVTVAEFCEAEGVSTASFYAWRRRLRTGSTLAAGPPLFVPVSVTPASGVRIELPGGAVVQIPAEADERLVRACIRAAAEREADAAAELQRDAESERC